MVMTDQDLDGSHIKGLCINLFIVNGRPCSYSRIHLLYEYSILRKGAQVKLFYNDGEYNQWKESWKMEHKDGRSNILRV